MRQLALLALVLVLVAMGGCYYTEGGNSPCWGLIRTEQRCVYRSPASDGAEGYECAKLKRILFDEQALAPSEVLMDCRPNDAESTITILKNVDSCEIHRIGGCVE